jgi:integrase
VKVKAGNVTLTLYPWKHPSGRDYFRFDYTCPETGRVKQITRATEAKAKAAARAKCIELSHGSLSLESLPPTTIARLRRLLAADPGLSFADDYLVTMHKQHPKKPLSEALAEFLQTKRANRGASLANTQQLERNLKKLPTHCGPDTHIAHVTPAILERYITGDGTRAPRYRTNIRRSLISLFRWARTRGYLPEAATTAAERTEKPIITRKIPATYTTEELRIILTHCRPQHRTWFALQAWAGIRGDELLSPSPDKSPLAWTDVDLKANIITVRPETAKTKQKRIIPICEPLREILRAAHKKSGNIASFDPRQASNGQSETKRIGAILGGWKQNALRHSFISYRAAQIGLGRTAMEAGNSESEARRSYNDAMTSEQADAWFSCEHTQNISKTP